MATTSCTPISQLRNFAIIAHIDHGKSTLSDRLIEACSALDQRQMRAQVLDSLAVERRRGITVKAQTVRLHYQVQPQQTYVLNLMDTPGHVDFSYEVSRCLVACEGVLLLIDASQGVEAQTLAHTYLAIERGLAIIPVINKIDLTSADLEMVNRQLKDIIGLDPATAIHISAKQGLGIDTILEHIVTDLPPPGGDIAAPFTAMLIDSWYDAFQGVIILVRVMNGTIRRRERVRLLATGYESEIESLGYFCPDAKPTDQLSCGEVGFIITGLKELKQSKVGDTLVRAQKPYPIALPGFKLIPPMVFCGFYPESSDDFPHLRDAVAKLALNDSSFQYEVESSGALGMGLRCGFLGLLHLEIIRERLQEEFMLALISTAPSVVYQLTLTNGDQIELYNPGEYPEPTRVKSSKEPWLRATIFTPDKYLGGMLTLLSERRGIQLSISYVSEVRVMLEYELPLNEIVFDFHDRLKSVSQGYASFDYEFSDYRSAELVKLNILINGDTNEALATIVPASKAEARGRQMVEKLKKLIPRQQYRVIIQAAIGGKIIARETVSAFRKDVTAKCYGRDATRKQKLLEKQREGKKRMQQSGRIHIPQHVFIDVLKFDS